MTVFMRIKGRPDGTKQIGSFTICKAKSKESVFRKVRRGLIKGRSADAEGTPPKHRSKRDVDPLTRNSDEERDAPDPGSAPSHLLSNIKVGKSAALSPLYRAYLTSYVLVFADLEI